MVCESFDGAHVWDKAGLSGYLVCLVHLVSLMQPNKPDRLNRPNEQDGWRTASASCYVGFFGSLNMKYMTTTTVPQNTTCLCQKRTSP